MKWKWTLLALVGFLLLAPAAFAQGPVEGSCEQMCGQRWNDGDKLVFDFGVVFTNDCSCEADCGIKGTCCADVSQWCCTGDPTENCREHPPGSGILIKQGTQYLASYDLKSASANGTNLRGGEALAKEERQYQQFPGTDNPDRTAAGLTGYQVYRTPYVPLYRGAGACSVVQDPIWDNGSWLMAMSSFDDQTESDVVCEAKALKFPENVTISDDWTASNGGTSNTNLTAGDYFPLMTRINTMDLSQSTWARCNVAVSNDRWRVVSARTGVAVAECRYSFVELESAQLDTVSCPLPSDIHYRGSAGSNGAHSGSCSNNSVGMGVFTVNADADDPGPNQALADIEMFAENDHYCFLQGVEVNDTTFEDTPGFCRIYSEYGMWRLQAKANHGSFSICRASCVKDARRADTTATDPGGWPPAPTEFLKHDDDTLGARLSLFQSGDYDRPLVFFEGLDASNTSGTPFYLREGEQLFTRLRDLGVDVWIVDLSEGGQSLVETMRELALAIDIAYKYQTFNTRIGRKITAVGVSMGGLAGRSMLASWEQGVYHDPSHPEFIAGSLGDGCAGGPPCEPPVAFYAASNGPHLGANVPVPLQKGLQDLNYLTDLGSVSGAINSAAAANMMIRRINQLHRWNITEYCGLLDWIWGKTTFRNGDQTLTDSVDGGLHAGGPLPASDDDRLIAMNPKPSQLANAFAGHTDQACLSWECPDWEEDDAHCNENYTCASWAERRDSAYFNETTGGGTPLGLNRRGILANGYPQMVNTYGVSNAGWNLQSCANYADQRTADRCAAVLGNDPFTKHTHMGSLDFHHTGATAGICTRDTRKYLSIGSDSLRPGDINGSSLNGLPIAPVMDDIVTLDVRQHIPFMFIPTESALHCGPLLTATGVHTDASCQAYNTTNNQFDKIMSRPDGLNGPHNSIDALHALDVMAMIYDALVLDADGYCDPTMNPYAGQYLQLTGGQAWACLGSSASAEADDLDPTVHEGAPELCDCKDNDQSGDVDEGLAVNSCGGPCGCPDSNTSCTVGVGECEVTENMVCDGTVAVCEAVPGDPTAEICGDALDSDCDGRINNDFNLGAVCGTAGVGQCARPSLMECTADGFGSFCRPASPGPRQTEQCDMLDWDCNGDHYYYTVAGNGFLQKRWPSPGGNFCDGPMNVSGNEPALAGLGITFLPVPESRAADLALPFILDVEGEFTRICGNNIDEDGDGLKDCADPNCAGAPNCPVDPPVTCKKNCPHQE